MRVGTLGGNYRADIHARVTYGKSVNTSSAPASRNNATCNTAIEGQCIGSAFDFAVYGCTTKPAACAFFTNAEVVAFPVAFHITTRPSGGPIPCTVYAIFLKPFGVHTSS
jgi:hypothetical protein